METKKDINKINKDIKENINKVENVSINIKEEKKDLMKMESGIYHDGKKYLYEPDEEFKSCCMTCDKELVLYIGKMSISISVLLFSFYMLQNPENDVAYYTSTLSLLLGHFLNNSIKNSNNNEKENKK